MHLLIAGDVVPTQSNMEIFNEADIKTLLGKELFYLWNSADFRIFNLEAPLVDHKDPIRKCGPNLIVPTSAINGINKLRPSLISLANNHILDQSKQGLKSTMDLLNQYKIPYVGAGKNISEASKPYIIENDGFNIGIYNCAEHEFSIASENCPGANLFDPLESLDHIQNLKSHCDYVIVIYHGGKEHYRYPSPYLQKVSRKIVEKGADLVVCQHSHCIGCFEKYKDSTIVYGQGNFIFDDSDCEHWLTSLLIKVEIKDACIVNFIPIVKKRNVVNLAEGAVEKQIIDGFLKRSKEILQDGFVIAEYEKLAENNKLAYMTRLSGMGKWLSRIDRLILKNSIIKRRFNNKNMLMIQNIIECEAHRELLLTGLKGGSKIDR